jgi:phage recombination protein Bet
MENTETALVVASEAPTTTQITIEKLRAVRAIIAPNLTDAELLVFAEVCNQLGLNPFLRQIHAIKRGDKATFQTGIDGYRLLAARTRQLMGIDDPTYDDDDADHPKRATVTVYRWLHGQRIPFSATARWREYAVDNGPMWRKMPFLMLGKCAEALALRRAFPAELSGVYTDEEMQQADHPMTVEAAVAHQPATPETRPAPVTQAAQPASDAQQPRTPAAKPATKAAPQTAATAAQGGALRVWTPLRLRARQLGYESLDSWETLVREKTGKDAGPYTKADADAVDTFLAAKEDYQATQAEEDVEATA